MTRRRVQAAAVEPRPAAGVGRRVQYIDVPAAHHEHGEGRSPLPPVSAWCSGIQYAKSASTAVVVGVAVGPSSAARAGVGLAPVTDTGGTPPTGSGPRPRSRRSRAFGSIVTIALDASARPCTKRYPLTSVIGSQSVRNIEPRWFPPLARAVPQCWESRLLVGIVLTRAAGPCVAAALGEVPSHRSTTDSTRSAHAVPMTIHAPASSRRKRIGFMRTPLRTRNVANISRMVT